jgi:hypothetical protein
MTTPVIVCEFDLPGCAGGVRVEDHGEHHVGCATIEIVTPVPIAGATRFRTTNGGAYWSEATGHLVIHDASVILRYHPGAKQVEHYRGPYGWYISSVTEDESGYRLSLYDGSGRSKQMHLPFTGSFEPGAGDVTAGVFPSAYPR